MYYTKLKRLWDELDDLSEVPSCDCIHKADCMVVKKSRELEQRQRLMHFLMRLNDGYDSISGQILLIDPLPNVRKAYCMIVGVETQRLITGSHSNGHMEIATMTNRIPEYGEGDNFNALAAKSGFNQRNKKDSKRMKGTRFCDRCQRSGHTHDQCFKLIGYPDWYEGPKDTGKGKGTHRMAANVTSQAEQVPDSPLESTNHGQLDSNLVQALA